MSDGDVKLEGKLIAAEVVDVPAGALPVGTLWLAAEMWNKWLSLALFT